MQLKLHVLFLLPITIVFVVNSMALYISGSHMLFALNVVIYMSVVSISLLFLGNFCDKWQKNLKQLSEGLDTVNYSANLLKAEELESIYQQLKPVLVSCRENAREAGREGKGYLLMAKELGKITAHIEDMNTNHSNMTFFISDCISKNAGRMSVQLNALGVEASPKKKPSKKKPLLVESPLKAGSLRHSIRLAEKRLAA